MFMKNCVDVLELQINRAVRSTNFLRYGTTRLGPVEFVPC